MTCEGCKHRSNCIMYEPRMKAYKDYEKDNLANRRAVTND